MRTIGSLLGWAIVTAATMLAFLLFIELVRAWIYEEVKDG